MVFVNLSLGAISDPFVDFYRLLPNDRLLIRFGKIIKPFDVSVFRSVDSSEILHDISGPLFELIMDWRTIPHPITYGIPLCVTSMPALHGPLSSIRIAYCLGTHIHGVIVISTSCSIPQHIKVSDVVLSQGSVLGIDKFAYPCSSDSLIRGTFLWPGDSSLLQADTQLASLQQIGKIGCCDMLDDLSNTILISPSDYEVALLCILPWVL